MSPVYLGDELVVQGILSRLPVKSLLRLRCACKSWHSLISSPAFISSHLLNSKPRALLHQWDMFISDGRPVEIRLQDKDNPSRSLSLDVGFESPNFHCHVIGSAGGLICYYVQVPHRFISKLIIFNPEIKLPFSVLPPLPSIQPGSVITGFGYEDNTLDHKIILAYANGVYLYSLNSRSWKFVPCQTSWHVMLPNRAVFLKDCFHWLTYENFQHSGTNPDHDPCMLAFDIKTETFRKIPFPERLLGQIQLIEGFDESSIGVVQILRRPRSTLTHVWLMGQNGSWFKIADDVKVDKRSEGKRVLGFRNKDELFINHYQRCAIVSQSIKDKVVHLVVSLEFQGLCPRVLTHVPSLVLLDKMVA